MTDNLVNETERKQVMETARRMIDGDVWATPALAKLCKELEDYDKASKDEK